MNDEPLWVALATERLGQPCDQWLISQAVQGHGHKWATYRLNEAGVRISRESVRRRMAGLRPLINLASEQAAETIGDATATVASRAAQDVLAAAS